MLIHPRRLFTRVFPATEEHRAGAGWQRDTSDCFSTRLQANRGPRRANFSAPATDRPDATFSTCVGWAMIELGSYEMRKRNARNRARLPADQCPLWLAEANRDDALLHIRSPSSTLSIERLPRSLVRKQLMKCNGILTDVNNAVDRLIYTCAAGAGSSGRRGSRRGGRGGPWGRAARGMA